MVEEVFPQSQAFRGVWNCRQIKALNKEAMTTYISTSKRITAIIARSPLLVCQKPTTNADPFTNIPEQKRFFNPHRMLNTVVERDLWEEEWLIRSLAESSNSSSFSSIARGWLVYFRDAAAWGLLLSHAMDSLSGRSFLEYSLNIWPIRGFVAGQLGYGFFTSLPRESVLNSLNRIFNFVRVCPNYKQEEICLYSPGFTPSIQKQCL